MHAQPGSFTIKIVAGKAKVDQSSAKGEETVPAMDMATFWMMEGKEFEVSAIAEDHERVVRAAWVLTADDDMKTSIVECCYRLLQFGDEDNDMINLC